MNTETKFSPVEQALNRATKLLTVLEIKAAAHVDEASVRAELKRLAQQGQIEHIPGRGRYDGRYGLLRPIAKAVPENATEPERRLTAVAQAERDDFKAEYGTDGNCSCHISPPCFSCTHPGNPRNQDEDESCWETVGSDSEGGAADIAGAIVERVKANADDLDPAIVRAAAHVELHRVIADIRAAVGDTTGKTMLGDLAEHIRAIYDLGEAHKRACILWEQSMMGAIGGDGVGSVVQAIEKLRADLANATALNTKLEHLLGVERQACAALRERLDKDGDAIHVRDAASGYLVKAPRRKPRIVKKSESAVAAAKAAAKNGSGRGDVFALVYVGSARRDAVYREAK